MTARPEITSTRPGRAACVASALLACLLGGGTVHGQDEPPVRLAPVMVEAPPPIAASSELLIPGKDFECCPWGGPPTCCD